MSLSQDRIEEAKKLLEQKCADIGCPNYRKRGYIFCENHLYGFPKKMNLADIFLIRKYQNENIKKSNHDKWQDSENVSELETE